MERGDSESRFSAAAPVSDARPHQQLLAAGARFRSQPGLGRPGGVQPGIVTLFLPQLLLKEVKCIWKVAGLS